MASPRLTPRKSPRQGRARATVDAMLEAAERLIGERGVLGFTTNHAAELAGVSIGSLYQYFPSKESLLTGLLLRRRGDRVAALAEALTEAVELPSAEVGPLIADRLAEVHSSAPAIERELLDYAAGIGAFRKLEALDARAVSAVEGFFRARGTPIEARRAFVITRAIEGALGAATLMHPTWLEDPAFVAELGEVIGRCLGRG